MRSIHTYHLLPTLVVIYHVLTYVIAARADSLVSIDRRLNNYNPDEFITVHLEGKLDEDHDELDRRLGEFRHLPRYERNRRMMETFQGHTERVLGSFIQELQGIFGHEAVRSYWISHSVFVDCQAKDLGTLQDLINKIPVITSISDDTDPDRLKDRRRLRLSNDSGKPIGHVGGNGYDFDYSIFKELSNAMDHSGGDRSTKAIKKDEENVSDNYVRHLQETVRCPEGGFDPLSVPDEDIPPYFKIHGIDVAWKKYGLSGKGIDFGLISTGGDWGTLFCSYRGYTQGPVGSAASTVNHQYNWYEPYDAGQREPNDPFNVGTTSLSLFASYGNDNPGTEFPVNTTGVANNAKWTACRGISLVGTGRVEGYIKCFEFFVAPFNLDERDPKPELRPNIVKGGFSCGACAPTSLTLSVQRLVAFGTFYVNDIGTAFPEGSICSDEIITPATVTESFTVGAANSTRREVAFFSKRGPAPETGINKPELVAAGTGINVLFFDFRNNTVRSISLASTQYATDIVAGAAALVMEACPEYIDNPVDLGRLLIETATFPIPVDEDCGVGLESDVYFGDRQGFDNNQGYGLLNVAAALERCVDDKKSGKGKKSSKGSNNKKKKSKSRSPMSGKGKGK